MSGIEPPGPERRRETDIWGRASDNAHVYQARNNQYIAHLHLHSEVSGNAQELVQAGMRGAALELTQERVTLLIRTLSLTQAELQARCVELEEEARQARAEGRAEALAEMQEQLQAAELRVMKTQEMMRAAVQEREKAEALLTQAQEELALRRRAEEQREQERARADALARAEAETAPPAPTPSDEGEQFTEFLERAEEQLGRVRADLRLLGEETSGQGGPPAAAQVIEGQVVRQPGESRGQAPQSATRAPGNPAAAKKEKKKEKPSSSPSNGNGQAPIASTTFPERMPGPGPVPRFLIGLAWVLCTVLLCIPMLVVTSIRAAYASDAAMWKMILFIVAAVLMGFLACMATILLVSWEMDWLDSVSQAFVETALGGAAVGSILLLVAAFFTPLSWPGPAGVWGRGLASAVGLG